MADILVVTPYNAQVNLVKGLLPSNARIGTVDKFQGQEAPICLVSMATSSGDELPRNIEFLFSVNRLNVAVSRAQALSIVFASPRLLDDPFKNLLTRHSATLLKKYRRPGILKDMLQETIRMYPAVISGEINTCFLKIDLHNT
jgi:superfamily I DNA and/or RNA helicase